MKLRTFTLIGIVAAIIGVWLPNPDVLTRLAITGFLLLLLVIWDDITQDNHTKN